MVPVAKTREKYVPLYEEDVRACIKVLPQLVVDLMVCRDVVLAGGFIRSIVSGESVNDIDLFFRWPLELETQLEKLKGGYAIEQAGNESIWTVLVDGVKVQLIHRNFFDSMEDSLRTFDFTNSSAAITLIKQNGEVRGVGVCHERFYPDVAARRLVFRSPSEGNGCSSLGRICKFLKRGYEIAPEEMAKVVEAAVLRAQPDLKGQVSAAKIAAALSGDYPPPEAPEAVAAQKPKVTGFRSSSCDYTSY